MSAYRLPSVSVDVLDNPRIINRGGDARIPAIVGLGPTSRSVTDEAVQRGTGSTDNLLVYPASGVSVSQIANTPGVTPGQLAYTAVSNNGALYSLASASVDTSGRISWPQGVAEANVPATGSVYYVTYSYNAPASQYDPGNFFDKDIIKAKYGPESNTTGLLTIAGLLALENGSPSVLLVQASGSSYSESAYRSAIDKLKKKSNIEQLIVVFPSGSVTRSQQESLLTYAYTHVLQMDAEGRERGLMTGSPSPYFASDGFDTIGDSETPGTYLYRANALKSRNVTYVVPSRVRRVDENGNTIELDGNFAAVAVAGVQAAQDRRSTPIHGFPVVGLVIEEEKWNDSEIYTLGAGNCLVLKNVGGVVTIVDALTTDPTSANTTEISVVAQERLVKRTLRDGLANVYTNKGKVITPTTTSDVEATTAALLQSLVNDGELFAFGEVDNPATGELKISAKQNPIEPRQIDVTCSVKYLYPLKFVSVTVSTYV